MVKQKKEKETGLEMNTSVFVEVFQGIFIIKVLGAHALPFRNHMGVPHS